MEKNDIATLEYYDKNAELFTKDTAFVEFRETQDFFLGKLAENSRILDFGCGAGRDTKYFLERGYTVDAIDGSSELCRLASEYTGISVRQMFFQELDKVEVYDGIWACASILHLDKKALRIVLQGIATHKCT